MLCMPCHAVQVRAPRIEEISSVEASLRLDAVASAGFRVSRSKMMDLIKAGGWVGVCCRQVVVMYTGA